MEIVLKDTKAILAKTGNVTVRKYAEPALKIPNEL